jgi:hypothetical protein
MQTLKGEAPPEHNQLGAAADEAIAACGGTTRDAVKALILVNEFLQTMVAQLQADPYRRFAARLRCSAADARV